MNTEYFKYLLTVAQYQSISKAADALKLQRSYLSKVLQSIEQELNTTIFIRSPRGVLLTDEGKQVLQQLQQILDMLEKIKNRGEMQKKAVYLQYYDEVTLISPQKIRPRKRSAQYLPAFQERFPNVVLSMIDADVKQMITIVQETPLAVAFTLRSQDLNGLHEPIPADLVYQPITNTPLVALAAPNNPLAREYQSMSIASLAKQELIFLDFTMKEDGILQTLFEPYEPLNIRYTVGSLALFYQLLYHNPYFSIGLYSDNANDELLQIPLRDPISIEQGILYHKDSLKNIVGKNFIELLLASYQKVPNKPEIAVTI